jgi:hypothetical protein
MLDTTTTAAPDWDRIKADFEAGAISVREIARREGLSDTAIWKKSKFEGWNGGLRKPDEPALPGLQTPVQTQVQTGPAEVDTIVAAVKQAYATAAQHEPKDDFEWKPENDAVLLTDRPAVAVYLNNWNQIVIRTEARWNEEEDPCIWIDRRDAPALIKRLEALSHGA